MDQCARQRILDVLFQRRSDCIPFTNYSLFSDLSTFERRMRNRGMGYVYIGASYEICQKSARVRAIQERLPDGNVQIRTEYETPFGTLETLEIPKPEQYTTWMKQHLFRRPEDYPAILWLIQDRVVVPRYERAAALEERLGTDFVVRDQIPLEPLQALISGNIMDATAFCYEWMENRDEILRLYQALVELNRQVYPVVALGPLCFANYGGNVVPAIIGKENFCKYYGPHYNEAAEVLHSHGKRIGSHLDDNNALIMQEIADTDLDYIEGYDPGISPELAVAFPQLKDKVLWINWPSRWHSMTPEQAYAATASMIAQKRAKDGLLIAITENMPASQIPSLYPAILDAIHDSGY